MAESLEQRYEKAADKYRNSTTPENRKAYHKLRDELVDQTRAAREANGGAGSVTADKTEVR